MKLYSLLGIAQLLSVLLFLVHLHSASSLTDRGQFRHIKHSRHLYGARSLVHRTRSEAQAISKGRVNILNSVLLTTRGGQIDTPDTNTDTDTGNNNTTMTSSATETTTTTTIQEEENLSPLTKLRRTIFPIYGEEVKKFFLISGIKFYIILALTLTRDTKDTLVVTQCGAEAIAFLKVCSGPYMYILYTP